MEITTFNPPARWRLILAIIYKELITIVYQPAMLISLLIPPFMAVVFLLFTTSINSAETIEFVVYDQGDSRLPTALETIPESSLTLVSSESAVFDTLNEKGTIGFVIPSDFDTAVTNNQSPELTVYLNSEARSSVVARAQRLLVENIATLRDSAPAAQINWTEQQPGEIDWASFSLQDYLFVTLVLLSMAIAGCGLLPELLAVEQNQNAVQAVVATPATLTDLLLGKTVACLLLTWLVIGAVSLVHNGWHGNWVITAVAIFLCSLFIIGIGLLLGLVVVKKNRIKAIASLIILLLAMPSWFAFTSLNALPSVASTLLRLLPTHYFVNALNQALADQPFTAALGSLGILVLATAVVYLLIGWRLSRNPVAFS